MNALRKYLTVCNVNPASVTKPLLSTTVCILCVNLFICCFLSAALISRKKMLSESYAKAFVDNTLTNAEDVAHISDCLPLVCVQIQLNLHADIHVLCRVMCCWAPAG